MPIHGYPGNIITANPTAPTVSSASGVWTTEQQLQAIAAGNWPGYEYPISRSLRFNSADSAYLNRTPSSAGNRKIWTWSGWVKRSAIANHIFFNCYNTTSTNQTSLAFETNGELSFFSNNASAVSAYLITSSVYRDVSAWYHVVIAVDTTQATSTNRIKFYVNGTQVTAFSTATYPSQNYDTHINTTSAHSIGATPTPSGLFNGYMTEINFIDGQALTPSSFGLNDPETGVWSPKAYTGTYGTNGFYVNFSDNSGTTSTTLGKDSSGNGNNWTPNNFSVTAGAGNDSLVDTPTSYGTDTGVGGEVRGNYATLNPLALGSSASLANGNLDISYGSTTPITATMATMGVSSGKWYWEATFTASSVSPNHAVIGITNTSVSAEAGGWPGSNATGWGYYGNTGQKFTNGTGSAYGATFTTNDVIGFAFDADAGSITAYKNGVSQGVMFSGLAAGTYFPAIGDGSGAPTFSASFNFGQRAFSYAAPSGFKALCTQNLPTPTIGATSTTQANDYFNVVLWTGTGNTGTRAITGVGFQPDFVWYKGRTYAGSNTLLNSIVGAPNRLYSNSTSAEVTSNVYGAMTSFDSDGFTGTQGSTDFQEFNNNGSTYVAWNWKAGGTGVTNTSGTITSTVSANTTSGFSIVTYTGTGANATVGHGLGVAPKMVIVKTRSLAGRNWAVYHTSLPATNAVFLNLTLGSTSATTTWNSTAPTSTVFSIGTDNDVGGTNTYVAYCFAAVAGYSAFGSYTGNGSADGPFVYLGFKPKYILFKNTAGGASAGVGNWVIMDGVRDPYNVESQYLYANLSNAEGTAGIVDATSNGFKLRAAGSSYNESSATHIYAAFAESPFKYSLAR